MSWNTGYTVLGSDAVASPQSATTSDSMGQIMQAALIGGNSFRPGARHKRLRLPLAQSSSAIAASGFERAARGTGSV